MKETVKGWSNGSDGAQRYSVLPLCPIKTRGFTFLCHISILAVLHFRPYRLQAEMSERYWRQSTGKDVPGTKLCSPMWGN